MKNSNESCYPAQFLYSPAKRVHGNTKMRWQLSFKLPTSNQAKRSKRRHVSSRLATQEFQLGRHPFHQNLVPKSSQWGLASHIEMKKFSNFFKKLVLQSTLILYNTIVLYNTNSITKQYYYLALGKRFEELCKNTMKNINIRIYKKIQSRIRIWIWQEIKSYIIIKS